MSDEIDRIRRVLRSKALNVMERIEQLEISDTEIRHLDSAIRSMSICWEDYKQNGSLKKGEQYGAKTS